MRLGDERWRIERNNGRSSRKWTFKEQTNKKEALKEMICGEEENLKIGCPRTQSSSFQKKGLVRSIKHSREVKQGF